MGQRLTGRRIWIQSKEVQEMMEITHQPEYEAWNTFEHLSFGFVFEFEEYFYMKLDPREALGKLPEGYIGWAIGLTNDGRIDPFKGDEVVAPCDAKVHITYLSQRKPV
jgi:hypothetical protein